MNPFQRAREEAQALREKLAPGRASKPLKAGDLLGGVEQEIGLAIESIPAGYADLGNGSAVLQREQRFIYVSDEIPRWCDTFCGLVAHELGHWILDANKTLDTVAHLKTLFGSDGSPAVLQVEAYGARERQELQANVFARELLLPRDVAKALANKGHGPAKIAKDLGIPLEFVRQQMLDAVYLPRGEPSVSVLKPPSADQTAAARATGRAANVVAGPGTGKTSTLIHRVKYLVEVQKVDPGQILVLTFTNKAAFELVERLRAAGINRAADIWAGTFHAFGLEFLRKYHQHFSLQPDFTVADRLTAMTQLVAALPKLDLKYYLRIEDPYDWLSPVIKGIKRLKEELVTPEEYRLRIVKLKAESEELKAQREDVAALYDAYETLLAERGTVDFVDLIAKPTLAISADRALFADVADKFQHVLVDEYQDVTRAMVELLRQIAKTGKSLWVVGDIRQAIHHWRGASLQSLLRFDTEFKAHAGTTKIQRFSLDINRRSHTEILDLVQEVGRRHELESTFPLGKMTAQKGLCNEKPAVVTCERREQLIGALTAGVRVLKDRGVPYGKQAVLCRRGNDVQKAAEALAGEGIPVLYIGELAQRPEIKRLLCLMQLLVERQPRALIGLVDVPHLSMPIADIRILFDVTRSDMAYQRGRWLKTPPPGLSKKALQVIENFKKLLAGRTHSSNPWGFVCDILLEQRFNEVDPADESVEAWIQRIALWQFAYSVRNGDGEMKEARLSRYMLRQRLRQRIGETYVDREMPPEAGTLDAVRIQTVHGAKGLEYEAVHIGSVDATSFGAAANPWQEPESILDIVPPQVLGSSMENYEFEAAVERNNLLYVAVSRAKRRLRLYQDSDFNGGNLTPQLKNAPGIYQRISYTQPVLKTAAPRAAKRFDLPAAIEFAHFDTYGICALQYWYARALGLKSEADIDVSVRARLAVMQALKLVASGTQADQAFADAVLMAVWIDGNMPTQNEDRMLWRDVQLAFVRGCRLIRTAKKSGAKFAEPSANVGEVTINLPWGFVSRSQQGSEFSSVRFSRGNTRHLQTVLKPMVSEMSLQGTTSMKLVYVLSDASDPVPGTSWAEKTNSYKAAIRLKGGDNQPTPGRHCGRCPYMTICPSAPPL